HPQDPSLSPEAHFPLQTVSAQDRTPFPRFINRFDSREILLVVSGSCINNSCDADKTQPPAALSSLPSSAPEPAGKPLTPGALAFPLETHGPSGEQAEPTTNQAKLHAVIAALQFRAWGCEGWRRVVVLMDREYIL
ncbi:hypothetical protein N657DRAFT_564359, partial [Parathielavia appendiculata]